jgi:hypothetical protein
MIASEPPRDCRRLFHVSHAAMAVRSGGLFNETATAKLGL